MMHVDPSESIALLRRIADASLDGLLVFDREFRYVLWNPVMERISGMRAEAVLGKCAFDVFPFLVETGEDRFFKEALSGNTVRSKDRPFRIEGTNRSGYYEGSYSPWLSSEGRIVGGIAVIRDITEMKLASERLEETENRFKNMADVSPVMLWMSRPDGLCTFFNQTWLEFTGRTLEEEWGVGWAEGVHFEDFQHCMDTYLDAFGKREVFEMEYRLQRKDGQYRWISDRGTPRYTPDGTFAGYIGSCIDITERKKLEEDLRGAVRVRDEFLSIASHELRTPITTLQLRLESLLLGLRKNGHSTSEDARTHKYVSTALEKTVHLADMVSALLDVSRISEGRLPLEYVEFDFARLARDVVESLEDAAARSGCKLQLHISGTSVGKWDRLRSEQVLTNLLSNAMKYGAGKPIEVSLVASGDVILIKVKDHGPGIPLEQQSRIFDRFVRFASTRHFGGFGLGLWITREVVEIHGGRIRVHSKEGEGTAFEVELPLRPPEARHTGS